MAEAKDAIYCTCHGSQYDPMVLAWGVNPQNHPPYVGALQMHKPAPRGLPVVPVTLRAGAAVGGMADPAWYDCCDCASSPRAATS